MATLSGTIYDDNNAGTPDGTTLSGVTVTLYNNGTSVSTTTDASGNYSFSNIIPNYYYVSVSTPSGYNRVSSTDASPTDVNHLMYVGSSNITGVNFGLNKAPVAANDSLNNQTPGSAATVSNILSNDSDPNSGTLTKDSISLVAPSGATAITTDAQGDVTGFIVPNQGTWALNSSTGAVTFTPQSGFTADPTPIKYTITDNAGLTSNQATISITYTSVPDLTPVILLPINAMNTGDSRDFVVRLNEIRNVATSAQIAFSISVPVGYTLTFLRYRYQNERTAIE
ncbi:SdrD B-like domain-containing protein [Taibaiella sp. KBW10]|uniref:SdrD B-like domain-containing protein n=1 Tax=Taibaiella sp. KBW10 TaxID=2153357 RepID=UPI0013159BAF|nr:SdrD B-like domain-containing protein [Taibaiella sp. KBW10]